MEDSLAIALKYFISILSIVNPLGAIPAFLTITRSFSQDEIAKISSSCAISVFVTLLVSSLLGEKILDFFGIHIHSFRIGGGIIIAMSALNMLRAQDVQSKITQDEIDRQSQIKEIGIVPLAIPLLAGPGAITTSIIQSNGFISGLDWLLAIVALFIIGSLVKLILTLSRGIRDRLGRVFLNVMTRIFGLILLAISIEHITIGIKDIFNL